MFYRLTVHHSSIVTFFSLSLVFFYSDVIKSTNSPVITLVGETISRLNDKTMMSRKSPRRAKIDSHHVLVRQSKEEKVRGKHEEEVWVGEKRSWETRKWDEGSR